MDFWLLGGLSLATFAFFMAYDVHYSYFVVAVPAIQLLVEFPHLMATYRLAYGRGREFRRRHFLALYAAPVLILAAPLFLSWTFLVGLIFFSVGYHRARQVYGIMIVYSRFDDYALAPFQKRLLSALTMAIWIAGYVHMNAWPKPLVFFGVKLPTWTVPPWLLFSSNAVLFMAAMAFFTGVPVWKALRDRRLPSANFLVPLFALVVWFWSYVVNVNYFLFLTPAFHALQYMACVAAYGRERNGWLRYLFSGLALVLAGFVVMRLVPRHAEGFFGLSVVGVYIFVSLHHYLLDSLIWKTSDPNVQRNLIGGQT